MSKGLEALKETAMQIVETLYGKEEPLRNNKINELLETKQFKIIEKELKALEFIKEKTLTINDLYWLKNGNYKEYRKNLEILYSGVEEEHLQKILKTQEEFDLLKEVLLCD